MVTTSLTIYSLISSLRLIVTYKQVHPHARTHVLAAVYIKTRDETMSADDPLANIQGRVAVTYLKSMQLAKQSAS